MNSNDTYLAMVSRIGEAILYDLYRNLSIRLECPVTGVSYRYCGSSIGPHVGRIIYGAFI
jgi:hypothetical protein